MPIVPLLLRSTEGGGTLLDPPPRAHREVPESYTYESSRRTVLVSPFEAKMSKKAARCLCSLRTGSVRMWRDTRSYPLCLRALCS
jgi:hypothetical protein